LEGVTKRKRALILWAYVCALTALFLYLMSSMRLWDQTLRVLFPGQSEHTYPRADLITLLSAHIRLVAVSSAAAIAAGVGAGILVTRPQGRQFLPIVNDLSSLAQTIPPVAVLALAVPLIGFGFKPTVIALFLYSILPILRNTISGIESISPELIEAAHGMGMTRRQILTKVELPLALQVIMAGVRMSVVINVGTATIGAVVGAGGLGTPIISGLVRENPSFVLEGAVAAALLAFLLDQILAQSERSLFRRAAPSEKRPGAGVKKRDRKRPLSLQ
jgi:osmoprotectant transport system permease protein